MDMSRKVVIGTRGSKLALWQAEWIRSQLMELHSGLEVELMKIKTTGDKIQDVPLAMVGGKGLFVKEIEEAMLRGEIDLAVHSMKDVPTILPESLFISVVTKREDPRDAFISNKYTSLGDMPGGAR
ncbi:MAG: hydroxymethylbilane synthase, partial [Thermodesulfovibrionales bacterium]|nr:hydroxymethylbilane synthase [Thermodesulfovibrionales bacterium]